MNRSPETNHRSENNTYSTLDSDSDNNLLATYGYDYIADIGEGAYSSVKLYYSRRLGHHVAIKIINKKLAKVEYVTKFLPRELKTLHLVKHPHIVDCYEILNSSDGRIFIVLEYTRHNDVLKHIQENGSFDEKRAQHLFGQLVEAVSYIHGRGLVHRDLKCENMLLTNSSLVKCRQNIDNLVFERNSNSEFVNETGPVKRTIKALPLSRFFEPKTIKLLLTDFGFARKFEAGDTSTTFCGSSAYAAPEIIQGIPYSMPKQDMWSMGIILYIMLEGSMPYDDSNPYNMIREQLAHRINYKTNSKVSAECRNLISKLIEPDAEKRLTITQLEEEEWILNRPRYSKFIDSEPLSSIIQKMDKLTKKEIGDLSSDTIDDLIKAIMPVDSKPVVSGSCDDKKDGIAEVK